MKTVILDVGRAGLTIRIAPASVASTGQFVLVLPDELTVSLP